MPDWVVALPRRSVLLVLLLGSALITLMSLSYFDFETLPPFVIEKLPVKFEALWLASLRVHVASASLAFPLCLVLMTRSLQRRAAWHRWLGRFTGVLVLGALVPSGIDEGLLKPLAKREGGSRFSRERPPPRERRVRVLESSLTRDKKGRSFVPFAVDVRFGSDWQQNDIVGCAYRESGNLFVKTGGVYRPATFLLGKNVGPVADTCEAAPPPSS